jgi:2,4-didehydro-3-deoxy-L-rhamnonate hydrolase
VSTTLNGETMQSSPASDMIFTPARLIEFASALITLEPGDVISTGTPAGVGTFRKPPVYLTPGDTVTVAVDRIGELTNPVEAGW